MLRFVLIVLGLLWGFQSQAGDIYQSVFNSVSLTNLGIQLKAMSGVTPVTVGGQTFSITDRYAPLSKMKFRAYWTAYMQSLGLQVQEMPYPTRHNVGEAQGHDLEAILRGQSPDSVVV